MFAHLNATTVLSRPIAEKGIYPAVDPLDSTSMILKPKVVGEDHYHVANEVKSVLQPYKDLHDIIAILGIDEISDEDRQLVQRAQDRALPVPAAPRRRAPHGHTGRLRAGRRDVRSFREILDGEYDDVPESAFLLKGAIDDVVDSAEGRGGRRSTTSTAP